jgi:hypothetical protein
MHFKTLGDMFILGIPNAEKILRPAVLEPGGTIWFCTKKPEPDETRHRELLGRMDQMTREIEKLRARKRRRKRTGMTCAECWLECRRG